MKANHNLIAVNIVKYRTEKNLTQKALAEKLDISPKTLSLIECSTKPASIDMLLKIANVLEIGVDFLLDGNIEFNNEITDKNNSEACIQFCKKLKYSTISQKEKTLEFIDMYKKVEK